MVQSVTKTQPNTAIWTFPDEVTAIAGSGTGLCVHDESGNLMQPQHVGQLDQTDIYVVYTSDIGETYTWVTVSPITCIDPTTPVAPGQSGPMNVSEDFGLDKSEPGQETADARPGLTPLPESGPRVKAVRPEKPSRRPPQRPA